MPPKMFQYEKIPKPKSLREVPSYLKKIISGFFSRLIYVFKLVHETGKWIFAALTAVTVLQGIIPVVLTYVSKFLLNTLQTMHGKGSGIGEFTTFRFSSENILFLIHMPPHTFSWIKKQLPLERCLHVY